MAKAKKEKEIKDEQVLETQAPEITETPVVDEGQPIMPNIEGGTDPDGGVVGELGDNADDVMSNPQEETQAPEDEDKKAPETTEGENEENTETPDGEGEETPEDKGDELMEKAQTLLEGDERIENAIKDNDQETAAELLKGELEKAIEIKAQLEADIEKREAEIKKKAINKKRFQNMFGGFWNGVSSGWED